MSLTLGRLTGRRLDAPEAAPDNVSVGETWPREPDRSKWGYETDGPPIGAAETFLGLLKSPDLSNRLDELKELVTAESWSAWVAGIRGRVFTAPFLNQLTHHSTLVRYPAEGMAYVLYPIVHPDQTAPVVFEGPTTVAGNVVTLLLEGDDWKVHAVGDWIEPAEVGKRAFSW